MYALMSNSKLGPEKSVSRRSEFRRKRYRANLRRRQCATPLWFEPPYGLKTQWPSPATSSGARPPLQLRPLTAQQNPRIGKRSRQGRTAAGRDFSFHIDTAIVRLLW